MTEGPVVAAFLVVVGGASLLAVTARRFLRSDDLPSLTGWALADRRLGPIWTWFLLGGTVFTAYTFVAVPGLVYGTGGFGFFALPYVMAACSLAFVLLPRLWSVAKRRGYVTVADFVRDRYGSPALALVVALTGILATMPYLALQLLGIRALLTAGGLSPRGATGDLAMVAVFAVLAVATYRHGLRAPVVISAAKGVVIFSGAIAALVAAVTWLSGTGPMFERAAHRLAAQAAASSLTVGPDQHTAYGTLALGSALALLMYPHVLTAGFAASGPDALRRASVGLSAWVAVLSLFGLLGLAALAADVQPAAGHAESTVPMLIREVMPPAAAGLVLGAIAVGALVPAAMMSIAAATSFVRNVYVEYFHPLATPKRQVRIARGVSLTAKAGAVAFAVGLRDQDAINLQLLGGVWILQIFPAVVVGLYSRRLHHRALIAGWAVGMAAGTALVVDQGFSPVAPLGVHGHHIEIYAGLVGLVVNLVVAAALTALLDRTGSPRHPDLTSLPPRFVLRPHPQNRGSSR